MYGCQGTLVFLMAVPHGLDDRLVCPCSDAKRPCPLGVAIQLVIAFSCTPLCTSDLHRSRQPSVYRNGTHHMRHAAQRQHATIQRRCKASRGTSCYGVRAVPPDASRPPWWHHQVDAPRQRYVEHAALEGFNGSDNARARDPINDEGTLRWLHMTVEGVPVQDGHRSSD